MAEPKYYGLILAGGRGTRFWPRSRKRHAKQVLAVGPETRDDGRDSLIQQTVDRLKPLIPPDRIWILTNGFVRDEIVRQLPDVPPEQIIAEPAQRNTAPAIGLAAHILASVDPDAVFGVFPSDHIIGDPAHYLELLRPAFEAAAAGKIAVLGVEPRWAETGYGYIEFPRDAARTPTAVTPVAGFREKPDKSIAEGYVAAGNFYWNAGMFFWKAQTILDELQRYLPRTAKLISTLPAFGDPNFHSAMQQVFPQCEDISIDFAVLERSTNVTGVPCDDFGWNDVGSWQAVYELLPRDENANSKRSETIVIRATGNYIDCGKKVVALIGVNNLIVVDTP
ncbi:MAG TPA: sugar phosphate nucleotidyltransferase, partial [Bryobacteraceae bacterium]|nr:sugar phosphate nucleotidyltransferase [Bryobacteraceae bacterium]